MKSFHAKVAAITGAGSGIGRALALALAKEGAELALSDINAASLQETAALVQSAGASPTLTVVDVADRDAIYAWAEATAAHFGKVNLIFNNAGVAQSAPVDSLTDEDFKWVMDINFWGVVHGTQAFLPYLQAAGEGHIINLSSLFGLVAVPGLASYNSSKFAVRGFTETLRQELDMAKNGVSVSCVHPGGIKTNIARDARMREEMTQIVGDDLERGRENFERFFTTTAEEAARVILRGVKRDKRRILVGSDARVIDGGQRLMPALYQAIVGGFAKRGMSR